MSDLGSIRSVDSSSVFTGSVDSQSVDSPTPLTASAESQIPESPSSLTASVQSQTSWNPSFPVESVENKTTERISGESTSVEKDVNSVNNLENQTNDSRTENLSDSAGVPDENCNMQSSTNLENPNKNQEAKITPALNSLNEVNPSIIRNTNESPSVDCDTKVLESVSIVQTNVSPSQSPAKHDNVDGCCSSKNIVNEQTNTIEVPTKMDDSSSQNTETHNNVDIAKNHSGATIVNGILNLHMDNTNVGGKRLSNSSPDLHIPNRDSGVRRCLETSASQESNRSADNVPDVSMKSKSHSELRSNSSKESQITQLFKQVKRVVSNSSAIKNYEMLSNTSLEVLSQNSIDLISHEGRSELQISHPQLSDHKRLSLSSQPSGKSHADAISFQIRRLKPQTSFDLSMNSSLQMINSGRRLDIGPGLSSPALSTKSLNFPSNERLVESSSDESLFRSRHHSLDKTSQIRPRRRSRRRASADKSKTSSYEQIGGTSGGEKNKAVSFHVQTSTYKPSEVNNEQHVQFSN